MAFFSKSLRNWTKKHDLIEGLTEWSPTKYAELTEFTAEFFPTDFRCNFRGCTCLRSALPLARARSAPTKQTVILPQISLYTVLLLVMTSHRFHRSTQMVRVRIIKTTKYDHVKDGKVADSIAVEHNVLATYFPTLFHRRRTESDRTANGNRLDGGRNPIGRRTETDWTANANGGTLRGCTCLKCTNRARNTSTEQEMHQPSKNCANRARAAPTEQELHPLQAPSVVTFSHRTHRTHRIYCCVFSHRFHGNTQIVRVRKIKTTD